VSARLAGLLLLAALASLAMACARPSAADSTLTVTIHHSRFSPDSIDVPVGVPVTITLRNTDPIEHEWIVGDDEVHERHRTGTEPYHDKVPTEVTIPALSTRVTTITFQQPGDLLYICHLPGHEAYGMVGTVHVSD
jgi:plastocyanin